MLVKLPFRKNRESIDCVSNLSRLYCIYWKEITVIGFLDVLKANDIVHLPVLLQPLLNTNVPPNVFNQTISLS